MTIEETPIPRDPETGAPLQIPHVPEAEVEVEPEAVESEAVESEVADPVSAAWSEPVFEPVVEPTVQSEDVDFDAPSPTPNPVVGWDEVKTGITFLRTKLAEIEAWVNRESAKS